MSRPAILVMRRGLLMLQDGGYLRVDGSGNLVLPAELAGRFGLRPGAGVKYEEGPQALLLHRPVGHLARLYVEPTATLSCAGAAPEPFTVGNLAERGLPEIWREPT